MRLRHPRLGRSPGRPLPIVGFLGTIGDTVRAVTEGLTAFRDCLSDPWSEVYGLLFGCEGQKAHAQRSDIGCPHSSLSAERPLSTLCRT